MDPVPPDDLAERVRHLEASVAHLRREVERLRRHEAVPQPEPDPPERPTRPAAADPIPEPPAIDPPEPPWQRVFDQSVWRSEHWLNRIGIALLLFGLAFLFKYSVDQGWLTPGVRIGFGAVLGTGLVAAGLRVYAARAIFSQALIGGGVATYYVTIFAAFQFYSLLPHPIAFILMGVVTLLALGLSLQRDAVLLAVIGTMGGLATPFLLYTDTGSLPALVGYTVLLLAFTSAMYLLRGWRSLLYTAFLGGWLVLFSGYMGYFVFESETVTERWALQVGVLAAWIAFGLVSVVRELWRHRQPDRWPEPPRAVLARLGPVRHPARYLAVASPLIAWAFTRQIWSLDAWMWGSIAVGVALGYAGVAWRLREGGLPALASAHGLAAAVLLAVGLYDLLDGAALLLALALEAAGLLLLARALVDRVLATAGHLLFALVAAALVNRLAEVAAVPPPLVDPQALMELAVVGLIAGMLAVVQDERLRLGYGVGAHLLLLGWLFRELVTLPNGQAYVTIAWGGYAVLLLVLGLRLDVDRLRSGALATIVVVVGKLFLVDLAELDALWRIVLFLCLGGAFLLLSYFVPSLIRSDPAVEEPG